MPSRTRPELLKDINQAIRTISAQSVLLSDTVASLVGLNSTDLECLDLLLLSGVTTAGRLAAHTGLTTGAMTAVIDRLERAGFAKRKRDPDDRRRVFVEAQPRVVKEIGPLYRRLSLSTDALHEAYTDAELTLIVDYLSRAFSLGVEHVNWLQTQKPLARAGRAGRTPARRSASRPGIARTAAGRA